MASVKTLPQGPRIKKPMVGVDIIILISMLFGAVAPYEHHLPYLLDIFLKDVRSSGPQNLIVGLFRFSTVSWSIIACLPPTSYDDVSWT